MELIRREMDRETFKFRYQVEISPDELATLRLALDDRIRVLTGIDDPRLALVNLTKETAYLLKDFDEKI